MGKKHFFSGLRWKFFFSFLVVSLLPLGFFAFTTSSLVRTYLLMNREKELKSKAGIISDVVKEGQYLNDRSKDMFFINDINERSVKDSIRILILDSRGNVINDSNAILDARGMAINEPNATTGVTFMCPEVIDALSEKYVSRVQDDGVTMYTAIPIFIGEPSQAAGVVLLVSSVADVFLLLGYIQNILVLIWAAMMVVSLIAAFFLSKLIISPLERILKVVTLMSEGHLNQRIEMEGHDEFAQLAIGFNNMNDKLEQVEKTREEFVSNVSHELKTPLSSIKVLSEAILFQENVPIETYREFLQDINSEVDRMTYIVNDLLTLVKLDQRNMALNIKQTEINKLVEDILKRLYPLAEQKKIELLYEDVRKVTVAADEMKLSLAISNLVENGIKYTPNGGTVKVIIDADHQNAFITVQDTGIGIAEEEQSKIFTRFYRVDKTRDRGTGGTGLGLSITHSTVLLHNGAIRLSSKENEGTTFVVRLPIHQNN